MKLRPKVSPGGWAWIGVASGVATADFLLIKAHRATMSEVFGNALNHPVRRWPVLLAWGVLSLHLFSCMFPPWMRWMKHLDPFGFVAHTLMGQPRV